MSTTLLSPESMERIYTRIVDWVDIAPAHRSFVPTVIGNGFSAYDLIWYEMKKPGKPIEMKYDSETRLVRAALEKKSEEIVIHKNQIEVSWDQLLIMQNNPDAFPLEESNIMPVVRQFGRQEGYFVYRGSSQPAIEGLLDAAGNTSTNSGKTGVASTTTIGFGDVVFDMLKALQVDGFMPPYALVVSDSLAKDLDRFVPAAPQVTVRDLLTRMIGGGPIVVENMQPASPDNYTIYPLPAPSSEDGVLLLAKPSIDNFELHIEHPLDIDIDSMADGRGGAVVTFRQAMTMKVGHADSICKHLQVDDATS